ncbi:MAG: DUF4160 domain-containing protein [Armatimonadota bacterium]|nr:DUF4160 domain-containing protein [Armatimonadota bacterium]
MPTVWRERGFRFVVFSEDHEPAHLHFFKAGDELVVNLGDEDTRPWVRENHGMKPQTLRLAFNIVVRKQEFLLEKWRRIHDN